MDALGNKKILAQNLRRLMAEKNVDRMGICKDLGIKYTTLSDWYNGVTYPRIDKVELLANYFGVEKSGLIEPPAEQDPIISAAIKSGQLHPNPEYQAYPMYGAIACGQPIFSDDNVEDMPLLPRVRTADFVLRCQGDSMIDANIFDGDYVYIHRQPDVDNGTIAAVAIDGEITLKRVIRQQGCVLLQPCNNRYAAALYTPDNCDDIHIVGKAVGVYSDLDGR